LKKTLQIIFYLLIIFSPLFGQSDPQVFRVGYVSAENVYLESGKSSGLNLGDQLVIKDDDKIIAEIEIIYISENSASCKILKQNASIVPGISALLTKKSAAAQTSEVARQASAGTSISNAPAPKTFRTIKSKEKTTRVRGTISAQMYHFDHKGPGNLDFTQPSFRFRLKAENLWDRNFFLTINSRARYNQRNRSYNLNIPETEWRNRIYELSLSYENDNAPINFKIGRIISNFISGVGYIDGAQIQLNLSPQFRAGILGGFQPEWQYSKFQSSLQKYGGYLNFFTGDYQSVRFESTLAAVGIYHSSTISREFLYLQTNLRSSYHWQIYQSAEIDINRKWREEKTGKSIALSNFYISAFYQVSDPVKLGLSYDNRKNYWSYEVMSMPDSLFDDNLRRGIRGYITLRLPARFSVYSNLGYRKREGDSESTHSFSVGLNKSNLIIRGIFINLLGAGFSNPVSDGNNYSARLGKYFAGGSSLSVTYGNYYYKFSSTDTKVNNRWLRFNGQFQVYRRFFLSAEYEAGLSGDTEGDKFFGEIGYRF
jgi:hypothetical protein